MSCDHNGIDCESLAFSQLVFNTCDVLVTYRYTIINNSNVPMRLDALIDGRLVNIIGNPNNIIAANSNLPIEKVGSINICEKGGEEIVRKGLAVASPLSGGPAGTAEDQLQITAP